MWLGVSLIETGVIFVLAQLNGAVTASIVGGVFLLANTVITLLITSKLDRRRHEEGTPDDRRPSILDRGGSRRGTDPEPDNGE